MVDTTRPNMISVELSLPNCEIEVGFEEVVSLTIILCWLVPVVGVVAVDDAVVVVDTMIGLLKIWPI